VERKNLVDDHGKWPLRDRAASAIIPGMQSHKRGQSTNLDKLNCFDPGKQLSVASIEPMLAHRLRLWSDLSRFVD
jgi:hypothetical protein